MRYLLLSLPLLVISSIGCSRAARSGPLIDSFNKAQCVPVTLGPKTGSPARTWDYMLKTPEGDAVQITGRQIPGGRIDVRYTASGKEVVAADAGDYIYPTDVRYDNGQLYVQASGVPVIGTTQTWVFAYDLEHQRQTGHLRVDPNVLAQECSLSGAE